MKLLSLLMTGLMLAPVGLLVFSGEATARCVDDAGTPSEMTTKTSTSGTGGCSGGGGSGGCAGSGASQTKYGAQSYASAGASWTCKNGDIYEGVSYSHGCGGTYDSCEKLDGCQGSCYGYYSSTRTHANGHPDAEAWVNA